MEAFDLKSTGVIRRIDDLGRIVIPKEIRRNLKIRDGENMEIFIDLDAIILKKYSKLDDAITITEKLGRIAYDITSYDVLITDREKVVAGFGHFKELKGKSLSNELINLIDERKTLNCEELSKINLTETFSKEGYFYVIPLISTADSIGLIMFYSQKQIEEKAKIVATIIDVLIKEQVDIT